MSLDILFDETQYRNCKDGEYQRKMVPLLLMKTGFNIMTVLEFGQAYNIQSMHHMSYSDLCLFCYHKVIVIDMNNCAL